VLVVGPSRSGKTRGILAPAILTAPGPVVVVSTKTDLLWLTRGPRAMSGTVWAYDPLGTLGPDAEGFSLARFSPLQGIQRFSDAVRVAGAMARSSRPEAATSEGHHWLERAETLVACVMYACACSRRSMEHVVAQVVMRDASEALKVLDSLPDPMPSRILSGILRTDGRELSGIFSSAASLLAPFKTREALESCTKPNFDPASFVRSRDTLFVVGTGEEQAFASPLIASLVEAVKEATYRRAREQDCLRPPVLLAVDEAAHCARIPALASIAAEGGGQGLLAVVCVQDVSQAGAMGMSRDQLLNLFPVKALLPGTTDLATLRTLSQLTGNVPRRVTTIGQQRYGRIPGRLRTVSRHVSLSTEPRVTPEAIFSLPPGSAFVMDQKGRFGVVRLLGEGPRLALPRPPMPPGPGVTL
jgi:type IV secretion system protein VirD4